MEGKVITAVSMCEPCNSTRFHIRSDELICNSCGTTVIMVTHNPENLSFSKRNITLRDGRIFQNFDQYNTISQLGS